VADDGFRWTHNDLALELTAMRRRLNDPSDALAAIGEIMIASVQKTVEMGGRPDKYQPLSLATLIARAGGTSRAGTKKGRKKMAGAQPLLDSGRLIMQSLTAHVGNWEVAWGSNIVYAAIQQFGGMAGRGRKVRIPARPYIQEPFAEDWEEIEEVLVEWAFGGAQ